LRGVIRYERPRWRPIWHSGPEKKAGKPAISGRPRGISSETPLLRQRIWELFDVQPGFFMTRSRRHRSEEMVNAGGETGSWKAMSIVQICSGQDRMVLERRTPQELTRS